MFVLEARLVGRERGRVFRIHIECVYIYNYTAIKLYSYNIYIYIYIYIPHRPLCVFQGLSV